MTFELKLETELGFAREFWNKAVEGLEPEEQPPKPDHWLQYAQELTEGWRENKLILISMLENGEKEEEIRHLLKCNLSIYLDLMSTISEQFGFIKKVESLDTD